MRTSSRRAVPCIVLALGIAACTVEVEGDDPADMEAVDDDPGRQNGGPVDADEQVTRDPDRIDDDDAEAREDEDEGDAGDLDIDAPEDASVAVATTELGDHLADGEGWSLYGNVADEDGESSCVGECLGQWPIVPAEEVDIGAGVDEELIGSITREDGTPQLTYAGYPLHRYADEDQPGEFGGHEVDDTWSVITPEGELLLLDGGSG